MAPETVTVVVPALVTSTWWPVTGDPPSSVTGVQATARLPPAGLIVGVPVAPGAVAVRGRARTLLALMLPLRSRDRAST